MNFSELNVIPPLLKALVREWFNTPTEIQNKVIPLAIKWKDILGCARTGSGKTLAFVLPMLNNLYNKRLEEGLVEWKIKRKIKALILAPTRELAIQIWETFSPYCTNVNMKHSVIYGWVNQFHQVKAIEKWVDVLVATPGRLEDLISQWILKLSFIEILVLDEADRMLEVWSLPDIKKLIKRIPKNKQTLFFSATMPNKIKELAESILHCPENIAADLVASTVDKIEQQKYLISKNYKRQLLQKIIKRKDLESIIVFVNKRDDVDRVFEYVESANIKCDFIHRWKTQNARQNALKALKIWKIKVLVATDIASRWLDINDLSCVINFDLPKDSETYVHRIWRTARAWKSWLAISFYLPEEKKTISNIEKLIDQNLLEINDDSYKNEIVAKGKWEKTLILDKKRKSRKRRF